MRCHGATVAAALSVTPGSSSRPEWEAVQWGSNDESLAISATVYRHLPEANDALKRRVVFVNRPALEALCQEGAEGSGLTEISEFRQLRELVGCGQRRPFGIAA